MINQTVKTKLALLPDSPGCYLMKHEGEIIYVGKAVNLKNRVRSYFHTKEHTPKVAAMVAQIDDFDILLCNTNLEALALECNLIKLHKPHYNILLKDDKHYPYVRIDKNEPFPRVTIARRMQKAPDEKERLRAAELLGKRFALFTDQVQVQGAVPVIIDDSDDTPAEPETARKIGYARDP